MGDIRFISTQSVHSDTIAAAGSVRFGGAKQANRYKMRRLQNRLPATTVLVLAFCTVALGLGYDIIPLTFLLAEKWV